MRLLRICQRQFDFWYQFKKDLLPTWTPTNLLSSLSWSPKMYEVYTVGWRTKAQCFRPPYLKTWFFYVAFNAELNGTIRILRFCCVLNTADKNIEFLSLILLCIYIPSLKSQKYTLALVIYLCLELVKIIIFF